MRKLSLQEIEAQYRATSERILRRVIADCEKELLPIAAMRDLDNVTDEDIKRLMDISCLSLLSNFIIFAVFFCRTLKHTSSTRFPEQALCRR